MGQFLRFVANNPTVFVSHQWLGFREPDPDNIHFPAIVAACRALCEKLGISPNQLYLWVDYLSIPQTNNHLKQLAIESLAQYASNCRYFLVVCPNATHANTRKQCGPTSYARRGWCRLEQWARVNGGGLEGM